MDNQKRRFIGYGISSIVGVLCPSNLSTWAQQALSEDNRFRAYRVQYTSQLPYEMSLDQYRLMKKSFSRQRQVDNSIRDFERQKKILATSYKFTGMHSIWTVYFNSLESFLEFQYGSSKRPYIDYNKQEKLGFKTSRKSHYVLVDEESLSAIKTS